VLFNSFEFILGFLPAVAVVFFLIGRVNRTAAATWLAAASLFFYGWWDPRYVPLLVGSVLFNFGSGVWIARYRRDGQAAAAGRICAVAIAANLALLGYFKYAHFFVATADDLAGAHWTIANIVLPLGISFFTFTQIAFLVDVSRGIAAELNFLHYLLFVTWFPHLIAGPVLHHKEMMPQFALAETYRPSAENVSVGLTMFSIGLFKKVVLADSIARTANAVFAAGVHPTMIDAWGGTIAYALQIYFDFSGYSDMAIGLSRIFGVKLPLNFNSPYKAVNITDFWRRWHMTLSRFLRDYLYISLGGNRRGEFRRYVNLMITMLLGGLWHGAGWTFVVWGGIHGAYLSVHHLFESRIGRGSQAAASAARRFVSGLVTFTAVLVAWVFFRATSMTIAREVLAGMGGLHGIGVPPRMLSVAGAAGSWLAAHGVTANAHLIVDRGAGLLIAAGLAIVWLLPNTQELLAAHEPAIGYKPARTLRLAWSPSLRWVVTIAVMLGVSLSMIGAHSEFLYFQF
jgi:D-alanyl-lipoteichoic acid acyltransferase DltB (MBOAT superfamily)